MTITGSDSTHIGAIQVESLFFPLAFSPLFLGKYLCYEKIGAGGFGEVWKAFPKDAGLSKRAVKLLHPKFLAFGASDPGERDELINRFKRETELTRLLADSGIPGIVRVYETGLEPEKDFIMIAFILV